MRIEPNDAPVELGYLELLHGLETDIESDEAMPVTVKRKLENAIERIRGIIGPYSA